MEVQSSILPGLRNPILPLTWPQACDGESEVTFSFIPQVLI